MWGRPEHSIADDVGSSISLTQRWHTSRPHCVQSHEQTKRAVEQMSQVTRMVNSRLRRMTPDCSVCNRSSRSTGRSVRAHAVIVIFRTSGVKSQLKTVGKKGSGPPGGYRKVMLGK